MNFRSLRHLPLAVLTFAALATAQLINAQTITHQITLPAGASWCSDTMIDGLMTDINSFRAQNGMGALPMNTLGMEDAEMRAVQLSAYMAANNPSSPGWDPHTGYDTTAASIGYNLVTENLAWATTDPYYIVYSVWQDSLHIAAMLSNTANVAGVSCVYANGWPYWTFEPGIAQGSSAPPPNPNPNPNPTGGVNPSAGTPALDSEESAFLTLINNYRAQNGLGSLQVSTTLQTASQWMSADLADNNIFSHTDSLGRSTGARLAAFNYIYSPWGENLAAGYTTGQDAFTGWETACDPDASGNCTYAHRANMLSPSYVAIGIARAYSATSDYGWYWTTDFGGYLDQALDPASGAAPVIKSFTAASTAIVAGKSTTLSWSASGDTSLSIDNGVGNVFGATSAAVTPSQTTTYHLTATDSTGTTTASVTVSVTTGQDTQPPTTPVLTAATAKSATEVDLAWNASTDNVGVAGYQITRNGVLLTNVPATALSYADTVVSAKTTYSYTVKAYDAAGNLSAASDSLSVITPAAVSSSGGVCPAPVTNEFTGCYYNNSSFTGAAVLARTDSQINFNWTTNAPGAAVPLNNFSVQWEGYFTFSQGQYIFSISTDGGMQLYIDGTEISGSYPTSGVQSFRAFQYLGGGQHLVKVLFYNNTGGAQAQVSWQASGY